MKTTMARDQYGHYYHDLGNKPRKELLKRLGRSHAERMFQDRKSGLPKHMGYVIGGLWLTIFVVESWEKEV